MIKNLIAYQLPNQTIWKASYDCMRRKTSEELQSSEGTSQSWEYFYRKGYLVGKKDPMGRFHFYQQGHLGRLIAEQVEDWRRFYNYNTRSELIQIEQYQEHSEWGRSKPKHQSIVERSYDPLGNISKESISLNGKMLQHTTQQVSPSGRVLRINDHHRVYRYTNDKLSTLTSHNVDLRYRYDIRGALVEKISPNASKAVEYNGYGLPTTLTHKLPEKTWTESCSWTANQQMAHYSNPSIEHTFTYSPQGQLLSTDQENYQFDQDVRVQTPESIVRVLDSFGKVLQESHTAVPHQLTYDAIGQLITQNETEYTWDPWGHLLSVTSADSSWEAEYDGLGRRLTTDHQHGSLESSHTVSFYK